jgi:RimJ/RimL family protein N-acetyltransferase
LRFGHRGTPFVSHTLRCARYGIDEANARSWRVAERAGFAYEGTLRSERCDPDGARRDMRVYALTR